MSTPQMPPAWYPDPSAPGQLRWWDGSAWTEHVSRPQYAAAQAVGPDGNRYATFWERLFGYIVDSFVIGIPLSIVFFYFGADVFRDFFEETFDAAQSGVPAEPDTGPLVRLTLWFGLLSTCVSAAYFIGTVGTYGRTLGQRALGIRVVDGRGGIPGLSVAGKRWLLPGGLQALAVIPTIGPLFSLAVFIDYLSMLWDPQKQCWHDKLAGTWVVRKERAQAQPYG